MRAVKELLHVADLGLRGDWECRVKAGVAYCRTIVILLAEFCKGYRFFIALFFVLESDTWQLAPELAGPGGVGDTSMKGRGLESADRDVDSWAFADRPLFMSLRPGSTASRASQ
ncbi:MAG: hypothetical protein P0Y59_03085 [Candidatus Sphingomonas phytovorans]|nr:hypothetical protein [Sphingomonas sp.]WEK00693.1 MAG: hypothetical protein P0Y59_03085 [Sphingomonas sp.]